jgi:hypothetical protein
MYHEGPSKTSYYNVDLDSNSPLSPPGTNMLDSLSPLSSTLPFKKYFVFSPLHVTKIDMHILKVIEDASHVLLHCK